MRAYVVVRFRSLLSLRGAWVRSGADPRAGARGRVAVVLALGLACTPALGERSQLPGWENSGDGGGEQTLEGALDDGYDEDAELAAVDGAAPVDDAAQPPVPAGEPAGSTAAAPATAAPGGPGPLPKPLYAGVDGGCGKDPGVGQRLKPFALKTPDGAPISESKYRGRVLLVNFWGTWCEPCLKELPEFDRLYRRYRKHGLTLVAIATDEDAAAVQEFVKGRKLAAKVAIGGEGYAGQYQSPKFPFTFVVDPKGVILASYRGYEKKCMGALEAEIRGALEARSGG